MQTAFGVLPRCASHRRRPAPWRASPRPASTPRSASSSCTASSPALGASPSWRASNGRRASLVAALVACAGCLTPSRALEVRLRDAADVDVAVVRPGERPLALHGDGGPLAVARGARVVRVDDRVVLDGVVVVRSVAGDPPVVLPVQGGTYRWTERLPVDARAAARLRDAGVPVRGHVVELALSTPVANVADAAVQTTWRQPLGVVPSLAAAVVGGMFAVGFGVVGGAALHEAATATPRDDAGLVAGGAYLGGAGAGLALAAYGVVGFWLLQGAPHRAPVDVR